MMKDDQVFWQVIEPDESSRFRAPNTTAAGRASLPAAV
jgi:hypothetical protein